MLIGPIIPRGYYLIIWLLLDWEFSLLKKCFVHFVTAFVMGELFLCMGFGKYMSSGKSHSLALILWSLLFSAECIDWTTID